uniref:Uncharacterized protein n=1 Tax=Spironucleus salmonicida TaxID=348837 RepID=V6LWM6_9EUKA|eukprot:EST48116.1 Hypothetical protein SS50377_11739 [Spironucleus salmonicida]
MSARCTSRNARSERGRPRSSRTLASSSAPVRLASSSRAARRAPSCRRWEASASAAPEAASRRSLAPSSRHSRPKSGLGGIACGWFPASAAAIARQRAPRPAKASSWRASTSARRASASSRAAVSSACGIARRPLPRLPGAHRPEDAVEVRHRAQLHQGVGDAAPLHLAAVRGVRPHRGLEGAHEGQQVRVRQQRQVPVAQPEHRRSRADSVLLSHLVRPQRALDAPEAVPVQRAPEEEPVQQERGPRMPQPGVRRAPSAPELPEEERAPAAEVALEPRRAAQVPRTPRWMRSARAAQALFRTQRWECASPCACSPRASRAARCAPSRVSRSSRAASCGRLAR